jgi:NADPH:quinone reductase-like Zn-dependent oxidoreductase
MRAAVLEAFGGPDGLVLRDWPDPVPGPDEALVRVRTVCANRTDVHVMHRTNIGRNVRLPHIAGVDPAGEVVQVGADVSTLRVGQRVVARPMIPDLTCRFCLAGDEAACERPAYVGVHRQGGFAELVALPARDLYPIPDEVSDEEASALAHSLPITLHLLKTVGRVGETDRVLVIGAGGGTGLAAVQVAKVLGARVIASAASEAKLAIARRHGADEGVNYEPVEGFAERVRGVTDGLGVTVVVDNVGSAELWAEEVAALDRGGRILCCGAHAGGVVTLDLNAFYRSQLRLLATAGTSDAEFRDAIRLVAERRVAPVIDRTVPLEAIRDAFVDLIERRNIGKIVVRVS